MLDRLERRRARVDRDQRRHFLRLMRHTAEATVDAQGRISVPERLAEYAGIEKEIVFVGAGDVIEMWNPESYRKYVAGAEEDFDGWLADFL